MDLSENSDTYLTGESYRSDIRTFKPIANRSNVPILGSVLPSKISSTVDLGMPVRIETWRIVKLRFSIISPSNIFIPIL